MKTKQELKEELKKEFDAKCLEIDEEQLARELFPEATKVFISGYMGDYWIDFPEVEGLPEAIELAEKLNPETIFICKNSCTSFQPESKLDEYQKENKNAKCEAIGPYYYKLDQMRQYPCEKFLIVHVVRKGKSAKIQIPIKNDPDTRIDFNIKFDRNGNGRREYCRIINNSGHFAHYIKWWASDDQPNNVTLY